MDGCCKHLRDGAVKDEAGCAMVLVCDHLGCVGGQELMLRLCSDYLAALRQQRAQASRVTLLQLENCLPASCFAHQPVRVLDGYMDPDGWLSEPSGCQSGSVHAHGHAGASKGSERVTISAPGSLDALLACLVRDDTCTSQHKGAQTQQQPSSQQPHAACVVVDNLTSLLLHHSLSKVLLFLDALRMHPSISCVLAGLHKDAHSQHVVDGLQHAASCIVELQAVGGLQAEVVGRSLTAVQHSQSHIQDKHNKRDEHKAKGDRGAAAAGLVPQGCVEFQYKARRGGRLRCDSAFYTILPSGGVAVFAPPPELSALMMPEALVGMLTQSSAAKAAAAKEQQAQQQQGVENAGAAHQQPAALPSAGGMRMGLSKEEREARDAVVLPYEHQGQQYRTSDWRDYLPLSAGGWNPETAQHARHLAHAPSPNAASTTGAAPAQLAHAKGQQSGAEGVGNTLGRILYVRDSDDGAASDGGRLDSDEDPDDDLDI